MTISGRHHVPNRSRTVSFNLIDDGLLYILILLIIDCSSEVEALSRKEFATPNY